MDVEERRDGDPQARDSITPAQRIDELLAIDRDITRILLFASRAVKSLTTAPPPPQGSEDSSPQNGGPPSTEEAHKIAFETHAREFFNQVHSVAARLRRQTYALEEANIIAPDTASSLESQQTTPPPSQSQARLGAGGPGAPAQARTDPPMQITNGGLGNLDVGWLNSRRDEVGKRKEAELWAEARSLVEKLERKGATDRIQADDGMDLDTEEA